MLDAGAPSQAKRTPDFSRYIPLSGGGPRGYFMLLEGLIEDWGIPLALYSDRHAVFKHNARKPETAAEATQFTRSLQELGIRQIFARSAQAKGRVERMGETFQDRLVTELRLAEAKLKPR